MKTFFIKKWLNFWLIEKSVVLLTREKIDLDSVL
jgi:hypothetical protein